MNVIHLQWDGPLTLEEAKKLKKRSDRGVYQVYGSHPIYGSDVLLYIGKTSKQSFSGRLNQESWDYNPDADNVRYYVGRLAGERTPKKGEWEHQIDLVEALLIYSHWPAGNSHYIQDLKGHAAESADLHVLNWGKRRSLLREVSGHMLTDRHNDIPRYHCYGDKYDPQKVF